MATIFESDLGPRRYDLDWVRIGAFMVLIFYHVGMHYVSWDFHVKSPHASTAIEPLMMLTSPWRLSLLFLYRGWRRRICCCRCAKPRTAAIASHWSAVKGSHEYAHGLRRYGRPSDRERFLRSVQRVRDALVDSHHGDLEEHIRRVLASMPGHSAAAKQSLVRDKDKSYFLAVDSIERLSAAGNYVEIHSAGRCIWCASHFPN